MRGREDDPGLAPTGLRGADGAPRVGAPGGTVECFSTDPALERVLGELYAGFGPQNWWPAETPFEVVVGAVLVQNTAWRNAQLAIEALRAADLLAPLSLLRVDEEELMELVRPSGTYRAKATGLRAVSAWYRDAGGLAALCERSLEPLRDELLAVRGIGQETADAVLCFAAGRRTPVVGAYARRVLARHGLFPAERTYAEARAWLLERLVPSRLVFEEFHALVVRVGYDNCKPRPDCESCPATAPLG